MDNAKETITRTYRISRSTAQQIDRVAVGLGCWPSPLVELLLRRALEEVETGRWPLHKEPIKYRIQW